jgi:hypothetical protein
MTTGDTNTERLSAVVWMDEERALVARSSGDGISMVEIARGVHPETQYLAHVVQEIGDGERVMVVGSGPLRLALEREYVSINHRPDRLISVAAIARADGAEIVDRLLRHAA